MWRLIEASFEGFRINILNNQIKRRNPMTREIREIEYKEKFTENIEFYPHIREIDTKHYTKRNFV